MGSTLEFSHELHRNISAVVLLRIQLTEINANGIEVCVSMQVWTPGTCTEYIVRSSVHSEMYSASTKQQVFSSVHSADADIH